LRGISAAAGAIAGVVIQARQLGLPQALNPEKLAAVTMGVPRLLAIVSTLFEAIGPEAEPIARWMTEARAAI
jgi:hypothetical protein